MKTLLIIATGIALHGSATSQRQLTPVVLWNTAALQGVRDAKLGAPVVARALAIVHTCIYDAWAAYDERAVGTQLGEVLRRPAAERVLANKEKAISARKDYCSSSEKRSGDRLRIVQGLLVLPEQGRWNERVVNFITRPAPRPSARPFARPPLCTRALHPQLSARPLYARSVLTSY